MLPQTVTIRDIYDESRTIRTFVLEAEVPEAEPGQFVMLWLPGVDEKPMSIACPAPLTVTVARVGPFSTALHRRKVGDQVGWRGPYGRGFTLTHEGHEEEHERREKGCDGAVSPAMLVAGGCGVGPIDFLAARAVERGVPVTVVLGARTALDLPYVARFRTLESGVALHLATDDGSQGFRGYATTLAAELIDQTAAAPTVYACGPERMLAAVHRLCRERGIPGQVSAERYMKCGFGVCGQCSIDGLLVCQDGPVFPVEALDDLQDFGRTHRSAAGRQLPIR
jgi:dihydroorotate dehydrogenase electron transfer subunit